MNTINSKKTGEKVAATTVLTLQLENKSLSTLQRYLIEHFPGCTLIPSRKSGKIPRYAHKGNKYTSDMFLSSGYKECDEGCLIILSESLIVIDIDDIVKARELEDMIPELLETVCCETAKGYHYYFKSTQLSKEAKMKDGARMMRDPDNNILPIDIKTLGGVISIPPSPDKYWIKELGKCEVLPMPESFVKFYVERVSPAQSNQAPESQSLTSHYSEDEVQKLVSMLSTDRASSYTPWMQLGWCLHNIDTSLLPVWDEFSKLCPSKYESGACAKLWTTMRDEGLKIGTLHMWAKHDNPHAYKEYMNESLFRDILKCNGSHYAVAKIAYKMYHKNHVCVSSNGKVWYRFNGALWEEDPCGMMLRKELSMGLWDQFNLVSQKHREHDHKTRELDSVSISSKSTTTSAEETAKRLLSISFKLEDCGYKDCLMREMRALFYDNNFMKNLDSNPNYIAFKNGIFCLKQGLFRPPTADDMVSLCVNYAYDPVIYPDVRQAIVRYFETLHPNADQRTYVLKTLARQLYGDNGGELFHIHAGHKGSAGNGKSKFFEILELALGDYVQKFAVDQLVVKQRTDPHKPTPIFHYWKGRRILYCSEPNADEKLNSGVMKELTGGEKITYRMLNCNETLKLVPMYKMHIMCNDAPQIDGSDQGVKRRIRKIDYISRFVDEEDVDHAHHMYLKDLCFAEKFKNDPRYRMEFTRYILSFYDHEFRFEMPSVIKDNSSAYLDDNNKVLQFANEYIVSDPESFFTLKEAREAFKESEYNDPKVNLKTALEKVLKTVCYDQKKVGGTKFVNIYMGYKLLDGGY